MNIFLCDDNIETLDFYEELLHGVAKKHGCEVTIKKFQSGEELLFNYEDIGDVVDVIYLDINMPKMNGVEVAEQLRRQKYSGEIVFLTVSEKHFLPAFDVRAFNYIIKEQTSNERFETIFLNIAEIVRDRNKESILLSGSGAHRKIEIDTIHYFEVHKRIVTVYYKTESFDFVATMERLESQLLGKGFIRINRAYLIAIHAIVSSTYDSVTLRNGDELPIGRTYRKDVRHYLKERVS